MSAADTTPVVVAVNVDYAATGNGHLDRSPCRITAVTAGSTVLLDVLVAVEPLHSAMTPYTGLTAEELRATGVPLDDAVAAIQTALATTCGGRAVLVGYNTTKICGWLRLECGTHYASLVDVVELTRTWNRRFGHWNFYSLSKVCFAIFGEAAATLPNSLARATALYDIYTLAFSAPFALTDVRKRLQKLQYGKEFPASLTTKPPICDSVCVWAYNDDECFCRQPTLERGGVAPGVRATAE